MKKQPINFIARWFGRLLVSPVVVKTLALLFFLIGGTILITSITRQNGVPHINIAPFSTASAKNLNTRWRPTEGGLISTVNDNNPQSYWLGLVSELNPNWVRLSWDMPHMVESIEILFGKDRYATNYSIQRLWRGNWETLLSVQGNTQNAVKHNLHGIEVKNLRISITETKSGDLAQRVEEFYVYGKISTSSIAIAALKDYTIRVLQVLLALLFFFLPGYVLLNYFLSKKLSVDLIFALSFATTILIILLINLLAFLSGEKVLFFLILFMLWIALFFFIQRKMWQTLKKVSKVQYSSLILALIFIVSYEYLVESLLGFPYQADYILPFSWARIFIQNFDRFSIFENSTALLNHETYEFLRTDSVFELLWGWHVVDRPPLLGFITIPFLHLFGNIFTVFKTLNTVFVIMFISPAILLVKNLYEKSASTLFPFFILINSYLIFEAINRPNRAFSMYFLFLYFIAILKKKASSQLLFIGGFCAGLAYLAHSSAIFYIFSGFVYLLFSRNYKKLSKTLIMFLLIFIPWILFTRLIDRPSPFFLYPFATEHWGQVLGSEDLVQRFLNTPVKTVVGNRIYNFLGLFIFGSKDVTSFQIFLGKIKTFEHSFFTLWGGTSSILFPFSILGLTLSMFIKKRTAKVFFLIILPILIQIGIVIGWYAPIDGVGTMQPTVVLLVMLGVFELNKHFRYLILPIYAGVIYEHILVIWKYYKRSLGLTQAITLGNSYVILGTLVLLSWYAYIILSVLKSQLKKPKLSP